MHCAQCGAEFEPKSKANRFCTRECQLAARSGRSREESIRIRETGVAWQPVQPAQPVKVTVPKTKVSPIEDAGWNVAVIVPDVQIGYQRLPGTEELVEYHSEGAMDIARQVMELVRPDLTVVLGDYLDLPELGKYRQEPGFALTTQLAIDRGHEELAIYAALSDEVVLIEGNHDARLHLAAVDNLRAAALLRRAGTDEYPALSVPSLLRLEELGIEYVGSYPSGVRYINDNLAAVHGNVVAGRGRATAAAVAEQERVSIIHGHVHRIETVYHTRNTRGHAKINMAHSPGCLCNIDGRVPSGKSRPTLNGRPARAWENWQQGLSVVFYEPGDGRFVVESIPILPTRENGLWAVWRGMEFRADG